MSRRKTLISAFIPPPNGWVKARKDGKIYAEKFYEDFRTLERYKEYKDCGFDEIMFAGETKYMGEDFKTSDLKKMLDLAYACDLSAVVFDGRILKATVDAQNALIGELFDNEQALDQFLLDCTAPYREHPAFYGVIILDEPFYAKRKVVREIAQAFKRVLPDVFVHTCFNPLSCVDGGPMQETVLGKDGDGYEAYGHYIDSFSIPELGYWGYDDYPFKFWEGIPMVPKYITTMQFVAQRCKKNGLPFHMTIQSYANNVVDRKGNPRMLDEDDLKWLANLALGFGVEKIYYYTYWRFCAKRSLDQPDIAIMDDDGSKILYNEVQRTNKLIRSVFGEIEEYQYEGSQLFDAPNGNEATDGGFISMDLGVLKSCSSTAPVLLNKLTKGGKSVYMLQNIRAPWEKVLNGVKIAFCSPKGAYEMLVNGKKSKVSVTDNQLELVLAPGEAVWFLDL